LQIGELATKALVLLRPSSHQPTDNIWFAVN
jgi:hypothetical protein